MIGAGGAARGAVYALRLLGAKQVTVVNRSAENARKKLARGFLEMQFVIHERLQEVGCPADVVVGCVPADDMVGGEIPAEQVFGDDGGGVVEMTYRPMVSALMAAARKRHGWDVCGGVDVLKEQAYVQFQLWTGKEAPVEAIERALQAR